jgi:hypothetical protein
VLCVSPLDPEEVDELELDEQLPELPLTPVEEPRWCVLEELLQLYAIVILGVFVIRNVAATKRIIPVIQIDVFIFICFVTLLL